MSLRTALLLPFVGLAACAQQDDASPIADPGPSVHGQPGQTFQFDGSSSVADSWSWAVAERPAGSGLLPTQLQDADSPWPFFVPDLPGLYRLELEVCLEGGDCDTAEVSALVGTPTDLERSLHAAPLGGGHTADPLGIEGLQPNWGLHDDDPVEFRSKFGFIRRKGNHAPVAIASAWQSTGSGGTVILDGVESYDPDGDALRYRWTFASLPAASSLDSSALTDPGADTAEFTPDVPGVYVLRLTVRDDADKASTTVMLEI